MDAFDSMLRERLARLIAVAPGHPGPLPLLPGQTTTPSGLGARRRDPRGPMSVFAGIAGILIVATIIGGTWLLTMPRMPAGDALLPGAGGEAADDRIVWDSGLVRLEADSVRIETPNGTFRAIDVKPIPDPDSGTSSARWSPSPEEPWYERPGIEYVDFDVRSDPGDRRYRTLEVTWHEAGVEMRMNIYFAADDTEWWATEVRVYDGSEEGDWIGWGGSPATSDDDQGASPSGDHESRLRAFGVPVGAEVLAASGGPGGFTSVVYRDGRGRSHSVRCDGAPEMQPAGVTLRSSRIAPAELCPPPPVDLGLFRSRRGEVWEGDVDLVDGFGRATADGPVSGELHIKGMRLSAFDR